MTARMWIEPVTRPDGWVIPTAAFTADSRGRRPGDEILCDRVHNGVCESCRVLMPRGIVGRFETCKAGIEDLCIIASTAELTVHEPETAYYISLRGDPSVRIPFPALRFRHQRARTMRPVGRTPPTRSRVLV
jgi:hypothetical protein